MTASYALAERIHRDVNASVTYKTDAEQYGVPEYWEPAGRFGDCEDYALLKRAQLLAAGWPDDRLGLCVCIDETGTGHAVLYVDTDRGGFILDNRQDWPVKPSDLPYTWGRMLWSGKWLQLLGWSS